MEASVTQEPIHRLPGERDFVSQVSITNCPAEGRLPVGGMDCTSATAAQNAMSLRDGSNDVAAVKVFEHIIEDENVERSGWRAAQESKSISVLKSFNSKTAARFDAIETGIDTGDIPIAQPAGHQNKNSKAASNIDDCGVAIRRKVPAYIARERGFAPCQMLLKGVHVLRVPFTAVATIGSNLMARTAFASSAGSATAKPKKPSMLFHAHGYANRADAIVSR
jgi:hypothetical protein